MLFFKRLISSFLLFLEILHNDLLILFPYLWVFNLYKKLLNFFLYQGKNSFYVLFFFRNFLLLFYLQGQLLLYVKFKRFINRLIHPKLKLFPQQLCSLVGKWNLNLFLLQSECCLLFSLYGKSWHKSYYVLRPVP